VRQLRLPACVGLSWACAKQGGRHTADRLLARNKQRVSLQVFDLLLTDITRGSKEHMEVSSNFLSWQGRGGGEGGGRGARACVRACVRSCVCACTRRLTCPLLPNANKTRNFLLFPACHCKAAVCNLRGVKGCPAAPAARPSRLVSGTSTSMGGSPCWGWGCGLRASSW
jgi:hypothetical protein